MRTMPETAAITAHITSPSCAIWPLISCPRNPPRVPCVSKSNGPVGRTLTSQSSSPKSEMRLPCLVPELLPQVRFNQVSYRPTSLFSLNREAVLARGPAPDQVERDALDQCHVARTII